MASLKAWNGSTWTDIGAKPRAWNGSSWIDPAGEIKGWNGSTWTSLWVRSDPQVFQYYPTWTQSYSGVDGDQMVGSTLGVRDDDLFQGYWDTSSPNDGHVVGVMAFPALKTDLLTRPRIVSGTLRLTTRTNYGGSGATLGAYLGVAGVTSTKLTTRSHTDTLQSIDDHLSVWNGTAGAVQTQTLTLGSALLTEMEDTGLDRQGITLHQVPHDTSEAGKQDGRGVWDGVGALVATRPLLTVTLDYV